MASAFEHQARTAASTIADTQRVRTGAEAVVAATVAAGVDVCFANAGTSEMALVGAIDEASTMRAVPVLFEGVASGAADGFARVSGRPACVMVHLGPGLANASANLHNARRAQSPVVVWVGEHARWLLPHDPPLASDIESIARATSRWVCTSGAVDELAVDAAQAVAASRGPVAGVSTVVLPMDLLSDTVDQVVPVRIAAGPVARAVDTEAIERAARALRAARAPLLLLGGPAVDGAGLRLAGGVAAAVGAKLMVEQFPRCLRSEPTLPRPERLGYLPFAAREQLAAHDLVVLLGADAPVCFFGYPGDKPRLTRAGATTMDLVGRHRDVHAVVAALAEAVDARSFVPTIERPQLAAPSTGALQPLSICRSLARALADDGIVVCEGITSSLPLYEALAAAKPHDLLTCKGGAIGFGTPAATGAAIAAPERKVVAYVGDGSALYTIQSLWTQAREGLDVTTIVLVNRSYAVLQMELLRSGGAVAGAGADLTEIGRPDIDFGAVARGFGVPATDVRDCAELDVALERAMSTPGPTLIAAHIG